MPFHVIRVAALGSFAFLLARTAILFTAIHRGADTTTVLLCGAAEGLLYAIGADRLAAPCLRRLGSRRLIRTAAAAMAVLIVVAPFTHSATALILLYGCFGLPLSLFWPAIHARIAKRIAPGSAPRVQAVFNLSWSSADLTAYASVGWLLQLGLATGLGPWLAMAIALAGIALIMVAPLPDGRLAPPEPPPAPAGPLPSLVDRSRYVFRTAGWLGNFGAYTVYDAVRLVFPVLAIQSGLPQGVVGMLIAVALVAQTATFALTTVWKGWVYRRRWFHGACALQFVALCLFMVAHDSLVFAIGFGMAGAALAAMYGASLFYSHDAATRLHEVGGRHEAMVGAARVAGPLLGAAAATFTHSPRAPFAAYAIVILLIIGINLLLFARVPPADRTSLRTAPEPA